MIIRSDKGKPNQLALSSYVLIVINLSGMLYVDDGKLYERSHLEMRQISTKINNTPASTG